VPRVDADGWPVGGVRFPEAQFPRGRPEPPAVPPVVTTSIAETCGNYGGFLPYDAGALAARGHTGEAYRRKVEAWTRRLEAQGFLLPEDVAGVVEGATR
jgi:hypothetical protein